MHIVRSAPMLIRGNAVHTTRVSTHLQNQLQNQPSNPQRAVCRWSSPQHPPPLPRPPPPKPPALHAMPAAVPVLDDFNYVDGGGEGPEEVRSDSALKVLDEEEELGRSTQSWD